MSAPVFDNDSQQKSKTPKVHQIQKKGNQNRGKKNLGRQNRLFDDDSVEAWQNSCNSVGWINEPINEQQSNYNKSYSNVRIHIFS